MLDDKLREILENTAIQAGVPPVDEAINQIKQAFADEGYVNIPMVETVTRFERGHVPEIYMVNGKEVMTGQEWYDRFAHELEVELDHKIDRTWNIAIYKAAKRAAGLDNAQG